MRITGRQLAAARSLLGWSQEQLATAADVTGQTISNWESEQNMPRPGTIARVRAVIEDRGIEFLNGGRPVCGSSRSQASQRSTRPQGNSCLLTDRSFDRSSMLGRAGPSGAEPGPSRGPSLGPSRAERGRAGAEPGPRAGAAGAAVMVRPVAPRRSVNFTPVQRRTGHLADRRSKGPTSALAWPWPRLGPGSAPARPRLGLCLGPALGPALAPPWPCLALPRPRPWLGTRRKKIQIAHERESCNLENGFSQHCQVVGGGKVFQDVPANCVLSPWGRRRLSTLVTVQQDAKRWPTRTANA